MPRENQGKPKGYCSACNREQNQIVLHAHKENYSQEKEGWWGQAIWQIEWRDARGITVPDFANALPLFAAHASTCSRSSEMESPRVSFRNSDKVRFPS